MFRFACRDFARISIPMMLPARPISPNTTIPVVVTSGGSRRRCTPSKRMNIPTPNSSSACAAALRISTRRNPHVRNGVAGRRASTAATSAIASPATSVSMCPASASSARLPVRAAPTTSTSRTVTVIARTTTSGFLWSSGLMPWLWLCPPLMPEPLLVWFRP